MDKMLPLWVRNKGRRPLEQRFFIEAVRRRHEEICTHLLDELAEEMPYKKKGERFPFHVAKPLIQDGQMVGRIGAK